jgi:hypothetical protein
MVTPSELEAVETIATGAQAAITDIVNVYGAKNLIPYDYLTSSQVVNGVTVTPLGDGTYKLNGTATSFADIRLSPYGISSYDKCLILEKGVYILTGAPIGSGASVGIVKNNGTNRSSLGYDNGNGYTFTHSDTSIRYEVKLSVAQNLTLSNIVFKPMLRLASIQDDTYVPYAKTNKELTDAFTNQISDSDDAYSPSKAYAVGEHCIYNNVLYKCITACSAAAWSVNQNCFEETTLTAAVTELNSDLSKITHEDSVKIYDNILTFYRIGNIVQTYSYAILPSGQSTIVLGTLPEGFRPYKTYAVGFISNNAPYVPYGTIWIDTNGVVTVYKPSDRTVANISIVYLAAD